MSIGIGLIGLGRHGGRYAQHLLDGFTGCHLVAVSRRDRTAGQAFAQSAGVVFVPDWREMLGRKVAETESVADDPTIVSVLEAFARSVAAGEPVPVSGEDGLRAVVMAEAAYRSAADGRPVAVPAGA